MRPKKRIDQLRAKVGDAVLQLALSTAEAGKKKGDTHGPRMPEAVGEAGPANNEAHCLHGN